MVSYIHRGVLAPLAFLAAAVAAPSAALAIPAASGPAFPHPNLSTADVLAIARVPAPPGGVGLIVHADFPHERPLVVDGVAFHALTVDLPPGGGVTIRNAVPARATRIEADGPTGECTDPTFTATGPRWAAASLPIAWTFHAGSVPRAVAPARAAGALRRAHRAWPQALTSCRNPAANGFEFAYHGRAPAWVGYDGVNTVDFGKLGSKALAVNYTWYTKSARIIEVDLRFNRYAYRWTARDRPSQRYQIRNVATHEVGHQLGLDDLTDPHGALTMFGRIGAGELKKTTLGKGDLKGASLLSP
ncbi:MAG: matrixin family metalloprotease [Actinomycetota bacterium]